MKLKNILLTLALVMGSLTVFGQTSAPDNTKPYVIFDSTYALESTGSNSPNIVYIYYDNTSGTAVKGIQFSFSYDNTAFAAPTVNAIQAYGTNGYTAVDVDDTNGIVKVVWVYTGASTTYDLPSGQMFMVQFPYDANWTNGSISGLDFTTDLTAYYATSTGTDATLGTQDNGGNTFEASTASTKDYTGAITIYPNPTTSIVTLQGGKQYDIEVYTLQGKKVMALTGNTIDMSHLSSATYIVKALDKVENEEVSYKVVKN